MPGSAPLRSDEVAVGCVTEDDPKYLGQVVRLVRSIRWFGGDLSRSRVVVGSVERIDPAARRTLEALGAEIRIVPRFHARNPSGSRLQIFSHLMGGPETHLFVLDCDTIVVRDPLPLLRRDVFCAKIAPLPTVTHEVFVRLFAHYGLPLPRRTYTTGYTGTPTIPYFNAGVLCVPAPLAARLVPEWRRFNADLADDQTLVAPCEKNLHQAALALALAGSAIPVAELGAALNFQLNATHLPAPAGYADVDPFIVHYHHLVDHRGRLLPCPFPKAQARIDLFHERLREERSREMGLRRPEEIARTSPRQIAVLGMHRSGTSLVARLLNAMGCYAGEEEQLTPPDLFNPAGYWEHEDVWTLDEEVLAALGATWLDPADADLARLDDASRRAFGERVRAIVHTLDGHGSWMMKDPRMAILFPLWRGALERAICVVPWREPSAVARSLARRDGLPLALGLALWEEYTRAILAATAGLPRVLVAYEELLARPLPAVATLHRDLVAAGAADLRLPSEVEVGEMIDPLLDRNGGEDEGLLNRPQRELRDALRSGAALQWESVPPIHPETRRLLVEYRRECRENARLRAEEAAREELFDAVFASRSWRLGFGLTRLLRKVVPAREITAVERLSSRRATGRSSSAP